MLDTAFYYADNFHKVKEIVSNFTNDGIVVEKAKKTVSDPDVHVELMQVGYYQKLLTLI